MEGRHFPNWPCYRPQIVISDVLILLVGIVIRCSFFSFTYLDESFLPKERVASVGQATCSTQDTG